jgi:peptide/nickel transport system ATP-binding protein
VVESLEAKKLHEATHPYTKGLLSCLPTIDGPLTPLPVLSRDASWTEAVA